MALNACEMWFNGKKTAFFSKKITVNRQAAGGFDPRPPVCVTFKLHWFTQHVSKITYLHFSTISLSLFPLKNPG